MYVCIYIVHLQFDIYETLVYFKYETETLYTGKM